ncbi:MAG: oligosaccharide flippase family protein [Actinomycetota bacterium]|nr:oligosaccharide flippase family protein [Actinomycetota bacterium]
MKNNYLKKVLHETKSLTSSQLLVAIISILQLGIVSKLLGPDNFGRAVLVITLISLVFRSLHARNSDVSLLVFKNYGTNYLFNSYIFDFLISFIGAVITLAVFKSSLNSLFGNYKVDVFIWLLVYSRIFYSFSETTKAILTLNGSFSKIAKIEVISSIIRFLLILYLFNISPKIEFYFLAYSSYFFVYGFTSLFFVRKEKISFKIHISEIIKYFQITKLNYLKQRTDQIVGIIPQHFDLVILSYFADYTTVGIYRVAKRLVEPIDSLISVLNPFVQYNLSNTKNNFSVRTFFLKVLLPISFVISLIYNFFGQFFIELVAGKDYIQSIQSLRILLVGYIIYFCTFWIRQKLLFNEKIQFHTIARLIGTVIFLISANFLALEYKAIGLSIAVSLGMASQKIFEFYIYKKHQL